MRRPTPFSALMAWHSAAIAGGDPERHEGQPECGWYKTRFVRKGPWVPARIYVDRDIDPATGELTRDEVLKIEIEGLDRGDPLRHWTYLKPISRAEFETLMDKPLRDTRFTTPYEPIDLSERPTPPLEVYQNVR